MVRITVRDEGVGLAPSMLESVFVMFSQAPQTLERSCGGLGLGLAIVRNIVELHGGTARAFSAGLGHGSEFVIEIPGSAAELEADAAALEDPRLERSTLVGPRVLVVDDNKDVALTLSRGLLRLGYEVAVAHDGPTALEVARAFHPVIALLDIGLPVMDGYELGQLLRVGSDVRLVAVTGYGLDGDRQRSREAGFEQHLVKPVDLRELHETLQSMV